jgi:REP-associated tyrosine transposase
MSPPIRTLFSGCPHHVTQRGYRHRVVFQDDPDTRLFLDVLSEEAAEAHVAVWTWALMANHVHLILVPREATSIATALGGCLARYEAAFEARHGLTGRLWQPRFYASVLDRQEFLWRAVRYVERNPVAARIVPRAEDYRWSSAAYHCGLRATDPLVSPDSPLPGAIADWSRWLAAPDWTPERRRIRKKERPEGQPQLRRSSR